MTSTRMSVGGAGGEQRLRRRLGERDEDAVVDAEVLAELPGAHEQRVGLRSPARRGPESRQARLCAAAVERTVADFRAQHATDFDPQQARRECSGSPSSSMPRRTRPWPGVEDDTKARGAVEDHQARSRMRRNRRPAARSGAGDHDLDALEQPRHASRHPVKFLANEVR